MGMGGTASLMACFSWVVPSINRAGQRGGRRAARSSLVGGGAEGEAGEGVDGGEELCAAVGSDG